MLLLSKQLIAIQYLGGTLLCHCLSRPCYAMPLLCLSVLCRSNVTHFLRLPNPRISSAVSAVNALPLLCSSEHWLIFAHLCLCMAMHISALPFLCPASQILAQAHLLYGLPFRGTSAVRFAFSSQCHATAFLNLASRFPLKACPCRASARPSLN